MVREPGPRRAAHQSYRQDGGRRRRAAQPQGHDAHLGQARAATPAAARRFVAATTLLGCASGLNTAAVATPRRDALDDADFWRGLREAVYDGQQAPLPRFDAFCLNCQQGSSLRKLTSGQVVARDGHYPGLAAHPVWETPPKWLFGLRLQAPQIADEMSEVLFERARLRAEGGAWRDGFLYGGAPGYRNFELFEVRTSAQLLTSMWFLRHSPRHRRDDSSA